MKQLFLTLLLTLAFLPLNAQEATYGIVRLKYAEMIDSLYRLNAAIQKVEDQLKGRSTYNTIEKDGQYLNARDHVTDSLNTLKWNLITQRNRLMSSHDEQMGLDVHLSKAGIMIQRSNNLAFVASAFALAGGACLGVGFGKDSTVLKVVGIASGVVSLACGIGSIACSYQSGHELKLAAGSITYSF